MTCADVDGAGWVGSLAAFVAAAAAAAAVGSAAAAADEPTAAEPEAEVESARSLMWSVAGIVMTMWSRGTWK